MKYYDLEAPFFCADNSVVSGMNYEGEKIVLSDQPGLGITENNLDIWV